MIKANELRIGNLLTNFLGETFPVNSATIQAASVGYWQFGEPQPIPLTEEWLLDFGYKPTPNRSNQWRRRKCSYLEVLKDYDNQYKVGVDCPTYFQGVSKQIKYVHSLQNLVYALTGEELTITK